MTAAKSTSIVTPATSLWKGIACTDPVETSPPILRLHPRTVRVRTSSLEYHHLNLANWAAAGGKSNALNARQPQRVSGMPFPTNLST